MRDNRMDVNSGKINIIWNLSIAAFAEYNCTVLGDGIIEMGCRSYLECIGGHTHAVDCKPGQVYSNITKKCEE